ncbi:Alpha/Beta hydrolase protein [Mycena filopes]|nr:Alpha/Beta hydrolase protein [Mycena filopes]
MSARKDGDIRPISHLPQPPCSRKVPLPTLLVGAAAFSLLLLLFRWQEIPAEAPIIGVVRWLQASECAQGTDCGSITVPKDYFDATAGTASIAIARFKATKHPKKGTVFVNPGGPGSSGTRLATQAFADLIGHDWDILAFDPRGVNKTSPQIRCFASQAEYDMFTASTVLERGFSVPSTSDLDDPAVEAQLVEQAREYLALQQVMAELCAKNMGDELRYVGTATVVRDLDFMARIFDGDEGKINYYGASYGSVLGAYLVNMLPHRAGFVAIDGIEHPDDWSSVPQHKWSNNILASTEKTYRFYLQECSQAGPEACPLANYANEPYENIETRLEEFFDTLARAPLAVPFAARPGIITSGAARTLLLTALLRPPQWANSARAISQAMAGNGTLLLTTFTAPHAHSAALARLAVTCIDSLPASEAGIPTPEDIAAELLKTMREVSVHFGAGVPVSTPDAGGCGYWRVRGPERFSGPWDARLEWPMLIVSNTMDPVTPLQNGLRMNALMPHSSRLIIQDGAGHCSSATPTKCTMDLVRGYFTGVLPENGTVCDTSYAYFPDPGRINSARVLEEVS